MGKVRTRAGLRAMKSRDRRIWRATIYRTHLFNNLDLNQWEVCEEQGTSPYLIRCRQCGRVYRIESMIRQINHKAKHKSDTKKRAAIQVGQTWQYETSKRHTRHVKILAGPDSRGRFQIRAFLSRLQWVKNLSRFIAPIEE